MKNMKGDPTRGIPVQVIARFCLVANVDTDWIFLGRGAR
jgi:hypothetical protein